MKHLLSFLAMLCVAIGMQAQNTTERRGWTLRGDMLNFVARHHAPQLPSTRPLAADGTASKATRINAKAAKAAPEFYGAVVYGDEWDPTNYGIYSIRASQPMGFAPVAKDHELASTYGGVLVGDRYYCTMIDLKGTTIENIRYNVYDATTWTMLSQTPLDDPSTMATDMTYDATTGKVYGCFYNDGATGYVWGTLDVATHKRTAICPLSSTHWLYVVASNAQGEMYGVRYDGTLVRIDKVSGDQTIIGSTGLTPQYMQAGEFDRISGELYWATSLYGGGSTLCRVDTTTGEALFISTLPDNIEVTVMFQYAAAEKAEAPAEVTALTLDFPKDATTGSVTFTLPTTTAGGEMLSGTLDYTVNLDGTALTSGQGTPGQTCSANLTTTTGMHSIEVWATNSHGRGAKATEKRWIGLDVPAPVSNATARRIDNLTAEVTWTAPEEGAHGGYLDPSSIIYRVVREPDAMVITGMSRVTTITDIYPNTSEVGNYYYTITPFNRSGASESVATNSIKMGAVEVVPPAAPTDFKATPGAKGLLNATLSLVAPRVQKDGSELKEITRIELLRNGEPLHTFNNPKPGEQLSFDDKGTNMKRGMQTWTAIAYKGRAESEAAVAEAFCGTDEPGMPSNVKLAVDGTHHPVITWKAPTESKNGGYFNPQVCYYVVMRSTDQKFLTETLYDVTYTDRGVDTETCDQASLFYAIWVGNQHGESGPATSNSLIVGRPYELPFTESFANGFASSVWVLRTLEGKGTWYMTSNDWQDDDRGAARFHPLSAGDSQRLYSGRIALGAAAAPKLEFYYRGEPEAKGDMLYVEVAADGGDYQTIQAIDISASEGWTRATFSLDDFKGSKAIQLGFRAVSATGQYDIYIDNVAVKNDIEHDLAVTGFVAPLRIVAGQTSTVEVTVENWGQNDASDYTVALMVDGKEVAETEGVMLEAKKGRHTFTMNYQPDVFTPSEVELMTEVRYDNDCDVENNMMVTSAYVMQNKLPAVNDLSGEINEKGLVLSWTAPDLQAEVYEVTTQGAEEMTPFQPVSEYGWTTVDGDGTYAYGIGNVDFPNEAEPIGFMAFNPEEAGLDLPNEPDLQPYSGNQYFAVFDALFKTQCDDWLISPRLSGKAQTIRFFARSKGEYGGFTERFDIMISAAGNKTSDFSLLEGSSNYVPTRWTEYVFELPEGTRHFAIHCTSIDVYMLMIDDIICELSTKAPDDCVLEGYDIYRNRENVAHITADATSWVDTDVNTKQTEYAIAATYNYGVSPASNIVMMDTSGVLSAVSNRATISVAHGTITVSGATAPVSIFDAQGRHVATRAKGTIITAHVQPGTFVVTIGAQSTKVSVR